jgi:hypothetical protein
MKKILVLVSMLIVAAACTTEPTGNSNMTANTNKGEMKSAAAPSEAELIAKEKGAWDAFKLKDADAFKKSLAPEYFGVSSTGVSDIAASIAAMKDTELTDFTLSDWKMTTIDKDAVLLTYTAMEKGTYKGKPVPAGPYFEASAYVNRNGEWVNVYYQETLKQEMAAPAASPSPPRPAPSAMAKAPETTDDPVANEKLVWDAIKSRNYDAFGFYLADDSLEIEPEGTYNKAGSVQGVQGFDASKAEASDWKTLKFDDDASVVTYKVKVPGMKPDTGYHSTIWVKRDGKWRAFFHMGSPAQDLTTLAASEKSASPEKSMSPEKKMSPAKKM